LKIVLRIKVSNVSRLFGITILFAAVSALLISGIPDAMAMPGPQLLPAFPTGQAVRGTTAQIEVDGGFIFTDVDEVVSYDGTVTFAIPGSCPTPAPNTGNKLTLVDNNGRPVGFRLDETGNLNAEVLMPYGGGTPFNLASVTINGPGVVTFYFNADPSMPAVFPIHWEDLIGSLDGNVGDDGIADDTTNLPAGTQIIFAVCGLEGASLTGAPPGRPTPSIFLTIGTLLIVAPLAGVVLSIDTAALLLAGATANAVWIMAIMGVIAGGTFALLRFQVRRQA